MERVEATKTMVLREEALMTMSLCSLQKGAAGRNCRLYFHERLRLTVQVMK